MKRVPRLFPPLFLCSAAVVHGAATGRLAGTVTDQEGQPVTGATIRVVDVISDKELASTAVRRDASYAFDGVPEGTPEVKAEAIEGDGGSSADNSIDIYFCRLNVTNRGKTEAEKVEVTARNVFKQHEGWTPIPRFVPLNLRWSNTWDIVKAGEDAPGDARILVKERISAGGERLCDLGFVVDPDRYGDFCLRAKLRDRPAAAQTGSEHARVRFMLAFEFIRDLERHRLAPGRYLLEVVVDAIRIRPKSFWIELQIPDTVTVPKNEKDRKRDLYGFEALCHERRPPGVRTGR